MVQDKFKWKVRLLKLLGASNPESYDLGYNFDKCFGELLQVLSEKDGELLLYYIRDNKSINELAEEYDMKPSNVRSCIYDSESLAKWTGLLKAFKSGYSVYENTDKEWQIQKRLNNKQIETLCWVKFSIPDDILDLPLADLNISRRCLTVLNKLGFLRFKDIKEYFGGIMYGNTPQLRGLGAGVIKELAQKLPEIGVEVLEVSKNI